VGKTKPIVRGLLFILAIGVLETTTNQRFIADLATFMANFERSVSTSSDAARQAFLERQVPDEDLAEDHM
jgi:hypothetical protein